MLLLLFSKGMGKKGTWPLWQTVIYVNLAVYGTHTTVSSAGPNFTSLSDEGMPWPHWH